MILLEWKPDSVRVACHGSEVDGAEIRIREPAFNLPSRMQSSSNVLVPRSWSVVGTARMGSSMKSKEWCGPNKQF